MRVSYEHFHITPDWTTFRRYFARIEKQGIGINVADYVGATPVRRVVIRDDNPRAYRGGTRPDETTGARRDAR